MILQKFIKNEDLRKIDHIHRFQGSPIIYQENITGHSWWVAFFARILPTYIFKEKEFRKAFPDAYDQMLLELITHGLMHDLPEIATGDLSHAAKYNSFNGEEIRNALQRYEVHKMGNLFGEDDTITIYAKSSDKLYQKYLLKICDWMALLKQLQTEWSLGNRNIDNILNRTKLGLIDTLDLLKIELIKEFSSSMKNDSKEYVVDEKFFHSFKEEIINFKL